MTVPGPWRCAHWHGLLQHKCSRALVNVISNTCASPAMTSENVCREKGPRNQYDMLHSANNMARDQCTLKTYFNSVFYGEFSLSEPHSAPSSWLFYGH